MVTEKISFLGGSALCLFSLLLLPSYHSRANQTRLPAFVSTSSDLPQTTAVNPLSASTSASFFGMTFNGLVGRASAGTLATPWPANAAFSSIRLWDSATTWGDLQPNNSTSYNWASFDFIVNRAATNGKDILYTFGRTPQWA